MAKAKTYKVFAGKEWQVMVETFGLLAMDTTKTSMHTIPITITEGHGHTGTTSPHIASLAARILKGGKYTKAQVLELAGSCVTQADGFGGNGRRIKKATRKKGANK